MSSAPRMAAAIREPSESSAVSSAATAASSGILRRPQIPQVVQARQHRLRASRFR